MSDNLKPKEKAFVKEYISNGNNSKRAAMKVLPHIKEDSANVMGHRLLRSVKEKNVFDEYLPEDLLAKIHREGLEAGHKIFKNNNATKQVEEVGFEPDYATRHRYLDSAYKLKGSYAPEKSVNVNVNADIIPTERLKALADKIRDAQ